MLSPTEAKPNGGEVNQQSGVVCKPDPPGYEIAPRRLPPLLARQTESGSHQMLVTELTNKDLLCINRPVAEHQICSSYALSAVQGSAVKAQ